MTNVWNTKSEQLESARVAMRADIWMKQGMEAYEWRAEENAGQREHQVQYS